MFEIEVAQNRFLLGYAKMLVSDLTDERMTEQPLPGVNHPAWILGHLAWSADRAATLLGGESTCGEDWTAKYGPGSQAVTDRSAYPAKADIVRLLEDRFERARALAAAATPEQAAAPNKNPRFRAGGLTTVADAFAFILTGHLALHLGQLSTWRRMTGLPPLF